MQENANGLRVGRRRNYANLAGFLPEVLLIKYQLVNFYGFLGAGENGWSRDTQDVGL